MSNAGRPFGGTQVIQTPGANNPPAGPGPAAATPGVPAGPQQQYSAPAPQQPYAAPAAQQPYAPIAPQRQHVLAPPQQQYAPAPAPPPQQHFAPQPPFAPAPQHYAPAQPPQQQYAQPQQQYAPAQPPQQQYAQPQPQQYAPAPQQQYAPDPQQQYAQPQPQQHYAPAQPPPQHFAPAPPQQQFAPAPPQPQYAPAPQQQYAQPQPQFAAPAPPPQQQFAPAPAPQAPSPVAMTIPDNLEIQPGFMSAVRLNLKTFGYTLPSFLYSAALSAVSFAIVGGTLALCVVAFLYINKYVAGAVMLLGFVPLVLFWVPFTWRKMFNMTAGHVAVMTELVTTGQVQRGNDGLFKYGRNVIATRFGDREGFRAFHTRLENMLGHLLKTLDRLDEYVPQLRFARPYLARLRGLLMRHIQWVVLSYAVSRGAADPEQLALRSMEATCYVVQNGMSLLKTALFVSVIERLMERVMWFFMALLFTLSAFIITYTVGFGAALPDFSHLDISLLSNQDLWLSLVAAVLIGPLVGYLVTSAYVEAVLRPFASTMVLTKFHKLIQNQALKPEWAERIRSGGYAADRLDWLSFKSLKLG